MTIGLLVVNRMSFYRDARPVLGRREPSLPLKDGEIFRRYRGFEGDAWPVMPVNFELAHGLAPLERYAEAEACRERVGPEGDLVSLGAPLPNLTFVGFDVGVYANECSHFSVILNEVLFGVIPDLRSMAGCLNAALLFEREEPAIELLRVHSRLEAEGADVERLDSPMVLVPVFGQPPAIGSTR